MPQGKMKIKAKLPASVAAKKKAQKGPAVSKRANKPQPPKVTAVQRLKNKTIKNLNKITEEELREKALDGKVNLGSKKRPAPVEKDKEAEDSDEEPSPSKKRKT